MKKIALITPVFNPTENQIENLVKTYKSLENIRTAGKYNYDIFPLIYPEVFNDSN